jgi:hypothetical protein
LSGSGDLQEAAPAVPRHVVVRLTARQRRAFARTGRTVVKVRTTVKGVVSATVRATLKRRPTVVARSMRAAGSASTTRVPLTLSNRARTVLRTKRRLRVVISVSYSESGTTARQVVMLRV